MFLKHLLSSLKSDRSLHACTHLIARVISSGRGRGGGFPQGLPRPAACEGPLDAVHDHFQLNSAAAVPPSSLSASRKPDSLELEVDVASCQRQRCTWAARALLRSFLVPSLSLSRSKADGTAVRAPQLLRVIRAHSKDCQVLQGRPDEEEINNGWN